MSLSCFHCGLPVPEDAVSKFTVYIKDHDQEMCCPGCQAVAQAIVDSGMDSYYQFRTDNAPTGKELVPDFLTQLKAYDIPAVQDRFVTESEGQFKEVSLILEGITCAACIWLNEQYLASLPGVDRVQINYSTHRAHIRWNHEQISVE